MAERARHCWNHLTARPHTLGRARDHVMVSAAAAALAKQVQRLRRDHPTMTPPCGVPASGRDARSFPKHRPSATCQSGAVSRRLVPVGSGSPGGDDDLGCRGSAFRASRRVGLHDRLILSGFHRAARSLAVYASRLRSRAAAQDSLTPGDLLHGVRDFHPRAALRNFRTLPPSLSARLLLAHSDQS
jgi:hypothetical protein